MTMLLDEMEVRILGSLIEKKLATPDYYPLSLNALTNACNQKSNRYPVVSYNESAVEAALIELDKKGLVIKSTVGRVPKYEEGLTKERNLLDRESAVLCVLLVRGPQTPGMIRGRTTRLYDFESLDEVNKTLDDLEEWGYAKRLPRLPGHKESRYMHLLSGEPEVADQEESSGVDPKAVVDTERMEKIEQEIETLKNELKDFKNMFFAFKKQFE